ncbi:MULTISPECIES: peroxiredoxin [Phaeobacter]|uniref:peroxiredoxin n=1 Tax=Phaeobacter TaxID=302485 RepID=UPI00058D8FE6|nr:MULTISPECIES: peroxiredoxin [Phaeobacter]ATF17214.1 peroxiredoxin [Phaeobacter gallaeciensis]ATF21323.1 peroxiredoxin [Phaeobacter gallaeciensis]ATG40758.1 peroxiredoxin [Phaeobacter piscinae]AXT35163.1 peroxiredoxin [Phaeobacter sp. LSS9]KII12911.1 thiol peroxidase [Phaeobacter sp. S60]
MISVGETLPEATLTRMGAEGPEQVSMAELTKGRTVAIFAVPGAFTPTCHSAHVPSFIRNKDALAAKGVDEIICIAGNDPFVMQAWSEATGAGAAGITMLSDAECGFTDAIGMRLDAPAAGLIGRSLRYAMLARDGKVEVMNAEDNPGQCELSAGEALLDSIG